MDLLARSGTPFFVSPQPAAMGAEQKAALKKALALAVEERPLAEPLDWMATVCPSEWKLGKNKVKLDWMPPSGSWPFAD
jgi:alpha-galactosidase